MQVVRRGAGYLKQSHVVALVGVHVVDERTVFLWDAISCGAQARQSADVGLGSVWPPVLAAVTR